MPSCTLSPDLVNFPSGTSTTLPPKPRKPPVLKRMALTLPSGPASMLCTDPNLLPSEEKTARPIIGFLAGAADCLLVDGIVGDFGGSLGFIPVGGVGAGSGLAAGGVLWVSGAGVCVWAAAASAVALDTIAAAPMRRRRVSVVMSFISVCCCCSAVNPPPAQRLRPNPPQQGIFGRRRNG